MVKVLTHTTDIPITTIGEMAGICWGADTKDHIKNFKRGIECIRNNHGRTLEFPEIYLEISGYSARVIREFYTHIGGSPTRLQESTRYVDMTNFSYITPKTITLENKEIYDNAMKMIADVVKQLEESGVPREDSAMLLPLGMETKIVWKGNLRTLVSMCEQRMCARAYWEFRKLVKEILDNLAFYSDEWKILIEKEKIFKSKCEKFGYCAEKNSCGKFVKSCTKQIDYTTYFETLNFDDIV